MATTKQRKHMQDLMRYLIKKEPLIHYAQVRPMQTRHYTEEQLRKKLDSGGSITMDCSEAVTLICRLAGLKNPNGMSYANGYGFTGTLLSSLPHYYNPADAGIGAIVIFGRSPGEHAAMVMEKGNDPLLFSHGGQRGPVAVKLSAEKAIHAGQPVTFLSIKDL